MGVVLRLNIHYRGVHMGLLKTFSGGNSSGKEPDRVSKPSLSPEYQRLNRWIESRIGSMDPSDPGLNAKLDRFLAEEGSKYPTSRGRLVFTPSGNDTIVTGDTKPFKGRLKRIGGTWEGKLRRWVIKNKRASEADVQDPSELAGLKAYINKMPYRKNLGGQ
jgi:hypothetical protein